MLEKYNIILHTTTSCNYNCSYCDVIKDKRKLKQENLVKIIDFIRKNEFYIDRFKFFWWEPLLAWNEIKYIIDNSSEIIKNKFEIVTNTTLLNDEIRNYFSAYFSIIFFSIDSENEFDYERIFSFLSKYELKNKAYFNLIISPWKEEFAFKQFEKLYKNGYKNFNILPVYFTKSWTKENLLILSAVMKKILDLKILDTEINLYWFQNNSWYNSSLINESLFVDIDLDLYYSDFVSTYLWKTIKDKLLIWNLNSRLNLNINIEKFREELITYENSIIREKKGQLELHKIMDYFSNYLNMKNGI